MSLTISPVFVTINHNMSIKQESTVRYRTYNEDSYNVFKQNISGTDFGCVMNAENVNDAYKLFITPFKKCYEEAFPIKNKRIKYKTNEAKPWLTKAILISCKQKNKLYTDYLKITNIHKKKIS